MKSTFSSVGPNWVLSMDRHNKLMRYQSSTFPLAVYGCMDTSSRKLLFIQAQASNNNPAYPACWYFEYLYESKTLSDHTRIEKGLETTIATMQEFLSNKSPNILTNDEAYMYFHILSAEFDFPNQVQVCFKSYHSQKTTVECFTVTRESLFFFKKMFFICYCTCMQYLINFSIL